MLRARFLLPLFPLLLASCGSGGGSGGGSSNLLTVQSLPLPTTLLKADARGALLGSFFLEARGATLRLREFRAEVQGSFGKRLHLRNLLLVWDRDADQRYDPKRDLVLARLGIEQSKQGTLLRGPKLSRRLLPGKPERWLLVGDPGPGAMGASLSLSPGFGSVAAEGRGGRPRVVFAAARAGGSLRVEAPVFRADFLAESGGSRAALLAPRGLGVTRLLVGARTVAFEPPFASADKKGFVFPMLLPPLPPGPLVFRGLDAKGKELFRVDTGRRIGAGKGPARFVDASLTSLPRSHSFSQDASVADLDGDGLPDILLPSYAGQRDRILRNLGGGRFEEKGAAWLPALEADTVHIEPLDADGDGDIDLALAVEGGQNRLYLNQGDGRMKDVTARSMPADGDFSEDLRAADVDGDGDMDFATANLVDPKDPRKGGRVRLYLNQGNGRFVDGSAGRIPPQPTRTYDLEFADFDGDGDVDLFLANYGEPCLLLENDGRGRFAPPSLLALAPTTDRGFHTSAAVGDLDGDGDLDVLVGTFQGQSFVLRNRGGLRFAEDRTRLPAGEMSTYDVALADLDGDGDLDAFFANSNNPSVLMENDGKGNFKPFPKEAFSSPDDKAYDIEIFDADGDGALDLFVAVWGDRQDALYLARPKTPPQSAARVLRVEPNYGPPSVPTYVTIRGANFVKGTQVWVGGRPLTGISLWNSSTLNGWIPAGGSGEADLTVLVPGHPKIRVPAAFGYEVPPKGAFLDVTPLVLGAEPKSTASVAAGDLDGDGLPDLVFGDGSLGARLRLSVPKGLMRKGSLPQMSASANEVELADVNGDKKLDLLIAPGAGAPLLLLGKGDGSFEKPLRLPGPKNGSEEVAVGDLDGDGDLDLVFATDGPEVVLRNEGKKGFRVLPSAAFVDDDSRGLALGDIDGDGDLDLVVSNFKQPLRLYLNGGKGIFREQKGAFPLRRGDQSYSVALADVDGDGDLDAAIANGGAQVNRLFLGDGKGRFVEAPLGVFRPSLGGGAQVIFGDVDLDGDPDLFSSHFWGSNHLYLWKDGRLSEKPGMLPTTAGGFAGAVFTDLDADGDLDLVLAGFWGGSRIWKNPLRQP